MALGDSYLGQNERWEMQDPEAAAEFRAQQTRQNIYNLLMQHGLQQPQGQMVGRFYVPPSWAQSLTPVIQGGVGAFGTARNVAQEKGWAAARAKANADAVQTHLDNLANATKPGPAVETAPGNLGNILPPVQGDIPPPQLRQPSPGNALLPQPPIQGAMPQGQMPQNMAYQPPTMQPGPPVPDPLAARREMIRAIAQNTNPSLQHVGTLEFQEAMQEREHQAQRELLAHNQQMAHLDRMAALQNLSAYQGANLARQNPVTTLNNAMAAAGIDPQSEQGKQLSNQLAVTIAKGGKETNPPPDQIIPTSEGVLARTRGGTVSPVIAPSGNPAMPPEPRPAITSGINPETGVHQQFAVGRNGKVTPLMPSYGGSEQQVIYTTHSANENAFNRGRQGDQLRSINVAHDHLDTWQKAAEALSNHDSRTFNKYANMIGKQFGVAAPTNLEGIASIVAPELVKAIVPNGGGEAERLAMQQQLGTALSPGQAKGVSDSIRALMMGQAQGLQRQYLSGPGATQENFNKKLSPQVRERMAKAESAQQPGMPTPETAATKKPVLPAFTNPEWEKEYPTFYQKFLEEHK